MSLSVELPADRSARAARDPLALAPVLAAIAYPWLLRASHAAEGAVSGLLLLAAFGAPALGFVAMIRSTGTAPPSAFERRARVAALLVVASPPLFVFTSFLLSVLGHPLPEIVAWTVAWAVVGTWLWLGRDAGPDELAATPGESPRVARVAHGVVASILLAFVAFHLGNHLAGLLGPEVHAAVMKAGRGVYRARAVEPVLVVLLLLQVVLGVSLARRWGRRAIDRARALQLASGVYLGVFVLTHLNSALVSARWLRGIETGWDWASGAPTGLLQDAWSIRLVPHYALGVFFVLAHPACGLRVVLLAHGVAARAVDRAFAAGLAGAAVIAAAILAGLCGARVSPW